MTPKVRFAHLGVVHPHGPGYLEGLLNMPEVEIVALYDPEPSAARHLAPAALRDVAVYDDLGSLLDNESPEAVVISLPNDATPTAIIRAAEAGAHVYAEKPCARTAAEFLPVVEAVRRAGVQFAMGHTRRFSPVGQTIKSVVDQGLIGRLLSVDCHWITTGARERDSQHFLFSKEHSGGGIVHWLGCHWLDLIRWATSSEVTAVAAIMDNLSGEAIGVEDTASLSLRYDNGMIGSLNCGYYSGVSETQLFFGLRGTLGWLRWDQGLPEIEVHSSHPDWSAASTRTFSFTSDPIGGYGGATGIYAQRRFIAQFREDEPPMFTTEDALRGLEVLDAAQESAREGRLVTLRRHGD